MKQRLAQMNFKPKDIMTAVKDEPNEQKYRLFVYAAIMLGVSTTFQLYFDGISYRAGVMQREALAGKRDFVDYTDKNSREIWEARKTLAVLEQKSLRDLKYILSGDGDYTAQQHARDLQDVASYSIGAHGLVTQTYEDNWKLEQYYERDSEGNFKEDSNGDYIEKETWSDFTIYSGPQGDPKADKLYFTETYDDKTIRMTEAEHAKAIKFETDPLGYSADLYANWQLMHSDTSWYDTAGCLSGGHVGNTNGVKITPVTPRYNQTGETIDYSYIGSDSDKFGTTSAQPAGELVTGWWAPWNGNSDEPYLLTYEQEKPDGPSGFSNGFQAIYSRAAKTNDDYGYPLVRQGWDVQIKVEGSINVYDEDLGRGLLRDYVDLFEDCDIECQQRGSGLSTVATLMSIPYALFGLTAVMMILGNVAPGCRVGALFCTICSGCILFIFLIVSATMLFSQYSAICRRSMVQTAGEGNAWYMADDFKMATALWWLSWIVGMCFCCCGCANAKNVTK